MTTPPPQPAPRSRRSWTRPLLWIALILLFATFLQWPSLKYRLFPSHLHAVIPWRTSLPAALAESQSTGKPVLLDISATWCPPCQEMKHNVWPDPRVAAYVSDHFIPVSLDADAPDTRRPAQRYGIQYIPAILILDPAGNVQHQANFLATNDLLHFLQTSTTPSSPPTPPQP